MKLWMCPYVLLINYTVVQIFKLFPTCLFLSSAMTRERNLNFLFTFWVCSSIDFLEEWKQSPPCTFLDSAVWDLFTVSWRSLNISAINIDKCWIEYRDHVIMVSIAQILASYGYSIYTLSFKLCSCLDWFFL